MCHEHDMEKETVKAEYCPDTVGLEEKKFEDLFSYNFLDNVKFIEGWRKVRDAIPEEKLTESLVKAEVYFYSREVSPVNLIDYQKWMKENSREIPDLEDLLSVNKTVADDENGKAEFEIENTKSVNDMKNEIECSDLETTEDIVAKHPANFIELIEMIQSGMKLPDTDDLNIEPLNVDPTPCDIQSPKKPWEVT